MSAFYVAGADQARAIAPCNATISIGRSCFIHSLEKQIGKARGPMVGFM